MKNSWKDHSFSCMRKVLCALAFRFSLREDRADDNVIDQCLRAGVLMRGTNLWVLMFAIFIASIGLNVNSVAIIIGAMLISPLMGPIMGVGYGVGIYDLILVRNALKNLGIAVFVSIATSSTYFSLSPFTEVQSELLARTTPTIWDVLIACFGGFVGIIAVTRKEKSTAISGVAIATALMPPLCTAGFGIAIGEWHFVLGAGYLFMINSVLIASTTAIVTRAYHVPRKVFSNTNLEQRARFILFMVTVFTIIPSYNITVQLIRDEAFRARTAAFVKKNVDFPATQVVDTSIDTNLRTIEVTLVGDAISQDVLSEIRNRLPSQGLSGANLRFIQAGSQSIDLIAIKSSILADISKNNRLSLLNIDGRLDRVINEVMTMKSDRQRFLDIPSELHALYPQIERVRLSEEPYWVIGSGWSNLIIVTLGVEASKHITEADRAKVEEWLRVRLHIQTIKIVIE